MDEFGGSGDGEKAGWSGFESVPMECVWRVVDQLRSTPSRLGGRRGHVMTTRNEHKMRIYMPMGPDLISPLVGDPMCKGKAPRGTLETRLPEEFVVDKFGLKRFCFQWYSL